MAEISHFKKTFEVINLPSAYGYNERIDNNGNNEMFVWRH